MDRQKARLAGVEIEKNGDSKLYMGLSLAVEVNSMPVT